MASEELTVSGPGLEMDTMFINMGPQHPSTHGVLRLGLTISGEVINKAVPDIGYLHRGTEKLMETRSFHQCVVLTDRWDYCSAMPNNLVFCLAAGLACLTSFELIKYWGRRQTPPIRIEPAR